MSYLEVSIQYQKTMLYSKSNKILSEISYFFKEKNTDQEKVSYHLLSFMKSMPSSIIRKHLPIKTAHNAKYSNYDLFNISILMAGVGIENVKGYLGSFLQSIFKAEKDTFYRFEKCENINWLKIQYAVAREIKKRTDEIQPEPIDDKRTEEYTCLILDDSDTLKTGRKIERISKVFSHTTRRNVLGQKTLTLAYWNKKSLTPLEFSKHGETNKDGSPLGVTNKQIKNQFSKIRNEDSPGNKRVLQYDQDKITAGLEMLERAKKEGFNAQYLLFDSWFFCKDILDKAVELDIKIVGMAKMGNAKYKHWGDQEYNAKELLKIAQKKKEIRYCKRYKSYYAEFTVEYKGTIVKLFLSKYSRKGSWNLLITNDLKLNYIQAVKIYSIRWSIEVMFKELKQNLGFEKCQSTDFDAHIAHTTLCFIQYAILAYLKRVYEYETIGQLFKELQNDNKMLTIADQIWNLIMEILKELSELIEFDLHDLLTKIFKQDKMSGFIMKLAS